MLLYTFAAIVLIATLIAHLLGMHGLYVSIPAYDIFMHIIGGIGIGLFLTAIVERNFQSIPSKRTKIVIGVFLFGVIWELIEMHYNIAGYPLWTKAYYIDTVKDLLDDTIGGILVVCLSFFTSRK